MFTPENLHEIYRQLCASFPEEAIERTKGATTKRGYDTTGIKYQYIVNRLNEVLGVGGFRVTRDFSIRDKQTRNGFAMIEATCDLTMQLGQWQNGEFIVFAEATGTGGHSAGTEADAKKGAFTNGFKKVAAFFGCGWQAYAGVIDDDNVPPGDVGNDYPVPSAKSWQPNGGNGQNARPAPVQAANENGRANGNGRITSAQLTKLRELVDEMGGQWQGFREHVREAHGVNVEYADKKLASELIDDLLATVRRQRGNGTQPAGRAA